MADDSNKQTGLAAKLGVVSAVLGILSWFGISNWHVFATTFLNGHASSSPTSAATPTYPPRSVFPNPFTYHSTTLSISHFNDSTVTDNSDPNGNPCALADYGPGSTATVCLASHGFRSSGGCAGGFSDTYTGKYDVQASVTDFTDANQNCAAETALVNQIIVNLTTG